MSGADPEYFSKGGGGPNCPTLDFIKQKKKAKGEGSAMRLYQYFVYDCLFVPLYFFFFNIVSENCERCGGGGPPPEKLSKTCSFSHINTEFNTYNLSPGKGFLRIDKREKEGDLTQSYDKTPYTNRKFENQRTTHTNATKNFDYTTIADRLRTVSWSNK